MSRSELEPSERPEDSFTTAQAASYLGVGRKVVLYWARRGVLPHGGTPGKWTYTREDLDAFRESPPGVQRNRNRHGPSLPVLITEAAVAVLLIIGVGWRSAPLCERCERVLDPDVYGASYLRLGRHVPTE